MRISDWSSDVCSSDLDVAMSRGEVGIVFAPDAWHDGCRALRDEFGFEMLADLCGIDYLGYGGDKWDTEVSSEGYSRSEARRVGKECVRKCRSRLSQSH